MSIEDRINSNLATLSGLVDAATSAKEANAALVKLHRGIIGMMSAVNAFTDDDKYAVVEALGDNLTMAVSMVEGASKVGDALNLITGGNREQGDALSKSLTLAIEGAWLEGDMRDQAEKLVNAWKETAPAKGGRTVGGSSTTPELGFTVKVKCEACNASVASTTKDNLNSLRDQLRLHHAAKHGGKFGKGDAIFTGVTEALTKVGLTYNGAKGDALSTQGGGYIADRVAS